MRNSKTPSKLTLAHVLMVLAGLMTFILVSAVLNDRRETEQVLVATIPAPAGSEVSALGLETIDVPVNHPLAGQFATFGSVSGDERIARDVQAGQPILGNDLLAPQDRVGVRTYTVEIDEVIIRGLRLRANDRVDLIGIGENGEVYYVVTDVLVSSLSAPADGSGFVSNANSSFLTVEVTAEDALELSAALRRGDLDVLRSTGAEAVSRVDASLNAASNAGEALLATGEPE